MKREESKSTKKLTPPADGDLKLVYDTAVTDLPGHLQEVKRCNMAQEVHAEDLSIISISLPAAVVSHQTAFKVVGVNCVLLCDAILVQNRLLYSQCSVIAQPMPAESNCTLNV